MNKSILDLAARFFSREMKMLLTKLLNESNQDVLAAHESPLSQKLLTQKTTAFFNTNDPAFDVTESASASRDPESDVVNPASVTNDKLFDASTNDSANEPATSSAKTGDDSIFIESRLRFFKNKISSRNESDATDNDFSDDDEVENSDYEIDSTNFDEKLIEDPDDEKKFGEKKLNENADLSEYFDDLNIESSTTKQLKKEFVKLNKTQQKKFDQNMINFKLLLSLNFHKMYTTFDLTNEKILNRSLRLLLIKRFDKNELHIRIDSHITYNLLPKSITQSIKQKFAVEQTQIQKTFQVMFNDDL